MMKHDNLLAAHAWLCYFVGVAFLVGGIMWLCGVEPEPREPIKIPTTEDVGRFTGKHSRKFGRGFIEGFRKERNDEPR